MTKAPVTIRASSFGALFDCPARWVAIHREGRRVPMTGNAQLGRAVHKGTAVFDEEGVQGRVPSLSAALDACAATVADIREEIDWGDQTPAKVTDVATSLTQRYCELYAPKQTYVAVEIGVDALELRDLAIVLTGTADRVRRTPDGLGISDLKTGKTAVGTDGKASTKGHAAQMGVYELVAEAGMGGVRMDAPAQVIGLQTNLTPEKQRIGDGEIVGAREVLVGDDHQPGLLSIAAKLAHGEFIYGNPKSVMCHNRYCPAYSTCFFRR